MNTTLQVISVFLLATPLFGQIQNQPDDGQWAMAPKNYASTRFSTLDQINTANVKNLKLAWSFSTGVTRGHEAAPLVVNNTMYVVTSWPNYLYALDLTKGRGTDEMGLPTKSFAGFARRGMLRCCEPRCGILQRQDLLQHPGRPNACGGCEHWKGGLENQARRLNLGESMTMAPLVVKGKVLVGNSGGEFGVRGWFAALDASTGKIAWRTYSTGPDTDVLIGPNFKPFYEADRHKDLGVNTWPGDSWKIGGGTGWSWASYDPDLDLFYYGTSNPGPWNPEQRPGDNKWTSALFARRPETGEAIWAYQFNPHDDHDYDGVNENILLDLNIGGRLRKILAHPDRNGRMYTMDRATGEVLSAEPFAYLNTSQGVDLKTGRLKFNPEKATGFKTVRDGCPAPPGGKDWQPSSYSPRTGLIYVPHNNLCYETQGVQANYIAGTPFVGMNVRMYAGPGGNRGEFSAWDPIKAKTVWSIKEMFPAWSGTVVTAGDVVFCGTMEGWFKALDARTGTLLWQFKAGFGNYRPADHL